MLSQEFMRGTEGVYLKGSRVLGLDATVESGNQRTSSLLSSGLSAKFEKSLTNFSFAIYVIVSLLANDNGLEFSNLGQETGFESVPTVWLKRTRQLKRWPNSTPLRDLTDVLDVVYRMVNL